MYHISILNLAFCYTSRLPGFVGREGIGVGGEGGEGGRKGGARAKLGFPPALPHCLLYFLKLYIVFNDNVRSIR